MQQGLEPALLFSSEHSQALFSTVGSGNVALQAQKSKTHVSPPNLTVCDVVLSSWNNIVSVYVFLPLTLFSITKNVVFLTVCLWTSDFLDQNRSNIRQTAG